MLTWKLRTAALATTSAASENSMLRREKVLRPGRRILECLRGFLDLRVCR
jgi:hypothetical protein